MNIRENIIHIASTLPAGVRLVAVSKTKPAACIEEAYAGGQRVFGENRPQEMAAKYQVLPKDIEWHLIGQLQEKNVKYIAEKIDKEAAKHDRRIDCLLEFHIAEEATKSGLTLEEAEALLRSDIYPALKHVRLVGVMGIATYTDDREQIRREFRHLHDIFVHLRETYFAGEDSFKELSMGMSGDYDLAIEEGSTLVRIGTAIFGEREYHKTN